MARITRTRADTSRGGLHQSASSAWITRERRLAIHMRDGFKCVFCGRDLQNVKACDRTLDHILPLSAYDKLPALCEQGDHFATALVACCKAWFGSKHKTTNVATACRFDNVARGNKDVVEYALDRYGENALARIVEVVNATKPLDITTAKAIVGNTRKNYKNAWSTSQRLSQGIGT